MQFPSAVEIMEFKSYANPPGLINMIFTLTILLFDSFGIKVNPEAEQIFTNVLKGNKSYKTKVTRFPWH